MTKTELFNRIKRTSEDHYEEIKDVNELIREFPISNDTALLLAILQVINANICNTMNNLALILCEMLPDEGGMNP